MKNLKQLHILVLLPILVLIINLNCILKSQTLDLIKPSSLKKGDKVAIISPGTYANSPEELFKAYEIVKALDLEPIIYYESEIINSNTKTRNIKTRVDEFHKAFKDISIKGIFCIRGGYGSAGLLKQIDWALLRENPKIFVGFSDITALLTNIYQKSGLLVFHGPVLLSNFDIISFENLKKTIFDNNHQEIIKNPVERVGIREKYPIYTINDGKATGKIIGGNLSIICSLLGTPFEIDINDKILFIEDVGESPYKIDRYLTQLKLSGKLEKCRGIIIGKCDDCNDIASSVWDKSELAVYKSLLSDLKIPIFYGLLIGHTSPQFTIPIGIEVEIDANEGVLKLLEKPISSKE